MHGEEQPTGQGLSAI